MSTRHGLFYLRDVIDTPEYFALPHEDRVAVRKAFMGIGALAYDEHHRLRRKQAVTKLLASAAGLRQKCKPSQSSSRTMPA